MGFLFCLIFRRDILNVRMLAATFLRCRVIFNFQEYLAAEGVFTLWAAIESLRALIATETTEFDAFISDFSKFSEFSGSKN